jgi:hypothetical protein
MRLVGHIVCTDEIRKPYKSWFESVKGKIHIGRPRRRWKDNINIYLEETEWEGVDWINLDQESCEHANEQ